MITADLLDRRRCTHATLARQHLLERVARPPLDAVTDLVGLQAQEPMNPYLALWSRLSGFDAVDLAQLVLDRQVVRIVVMRSTIHLVTADDCMVLRPFAQPVIDRELRARHDVAHWSTSTSDRCSRSRGARWPSSRARRRNCARC